jgi:hypothetical protein
MPSSSQSGAVVGLPQPTDSLRSRIHSQPKVLVSFSVFAVAARRNGGFENAGTERLHFRGSARQRPARLQTPHHRHFEDVARNSSFGRQKGSAISKLSPTDHAEELRRRHSDDFHQIVIRYQLDAGPPVRGRPVWLCQYE